MSEDRSETALRFLEQIMPAAGGGSALESTSAPADRIEAVLPASPYPAELRDNVERAAEKMARFEPLAAREQFALEAIIIPDKRPAVDIVGGDYQDIQHREWTHLNAAGPRAVIRAAIPAVGRVELPGHPSVPFGGTGFVVGDGLLMTNRHVAEIFCGGLGAQGLVFRPGHRAGIDFDRERDGGSHFLDVAAILMIHPYWDMALLRVEGLPAALAPLRLSLRDPDDLKGEDVAVIGYPAFDPRNNADVQNLVFNQVYDVKRMMPGKLNGRAEIDSFGKKVPSAMHDSSTLGGASGSAVVHVASGEILALHFAGIYLRSNYGVPAADLARDPRVVDAGVKFAGAAKAGAGPWDEWWKSVAGGETGALAAAPGPAAPAPAPAPAAQAPAAVAAAVSAAAAPAQAGGSGRWTIPIEISIDVGAAVAAAAAPDAAAATERMVEPVHEEDYANRAGYDSGFLGIAVPLPQPVDLDMVARLEDGDHVIPYHHFSVVMHRARRLALFTAANVDASPERKAPEPDCKYTRDALGGLGENDKERWFTDPRLRGVDQLPDRFFEKDNKAFDKGHLIRREDVAWGASFAEVQAANGDTFHTTNCSPQVAGFNRSNHKDNWGALEDLVLRQAAGQKLVVFAGPVLSEEDRIFVGVDERSAVKVGIPEEYWKVVVALDDGELRSFAFTLKQDLAAVPLEFAVPPDWQHCMISIADLEAKLGTVRFPKAVHAADQKGKDLGEAVRLSV